MMYCIVPRTSTVYCTVQRANARSCPPPRPAGPGPRPAPRAPPPPGPPPAPTRPSTAPATSATTAPAPRPARRSRAESGGLCAAGGRGPWWGTVGAPHGLQPARAYCAGGKGPCPRLFASPPPLSTAAPNSQAGGTPPEYPPSPTPPGPKAGCTEQRPGRAGSGPARRRFGQEGTPARRAVRPRPGRSGPVRRHAVPAMSPSRYAQDKNQARTGHAAVG